MQTPRETSPLRLAVNKTEAAKALGVSVDFFDAHIAQELRCVRRGRRRLYPMMELQAWLDKTAERMNFPCGGLLSACALAATWHDFLPGFLS